MGRAAAARLRAQRPVQRRHRHRRSDQTGHRDVPGRDRTAARRAVVRRIDAVGAQQPELLPHTDRSDHRRARAGPTGRRSIQPLLHSRRHRGDRRRRGPEAPRLPRRQDDGAAQRARRARVRRHQSHRLLDRRPLPDRDVRVRGPPHEDRLWSNARSSASSTSAPTRMPQDVRISPTARRSTSPR